MPVVFTYTKDVGRFVAGSLELPEWPEKSFMVGDKVTLNELLRLAQDATGKLPSFYQNIDCWLSISPLIYFI